MAHTIVTGDPGTALDPAAGGGVPPFQLLQWKHAIRLEQFGLKHSSGRSVKVHAARMFGMSSRINAGIVLAEIQRRLDAFDLSRTSVSLCDTKVNAGRTK